jgi:hypothetical protein
VGLGAQHVIHHAVHQEAQQHDRQRHHVVPAEGLRVLACERGRGRD